MNHMNSSTGSWIAMAAMLGLCACGGSGAQETASREGDVEAPAEQAVTESPAGDASAREARESGASQAPAAEPGDAGSGSTSSPAPEKARQPAASPAREETRQPSASPAPEETRQPSASPAPEEPATVTLEAGTELRLTLNREIAVDSVQSGDPFTANMERPVIRGDYVVIPAGSRVSGRVTAVQKATDDNPAVIKLDFETIEVRGESLALQATLTETSPQTRSQMTGKLKKIGGGAGAGAVLGAVIGGGAKEAILGAAAGAAAGSAVALGTKEKSAYLPAGSPIVLRLDAPLSTPAPQATGG